MTVFPPNREDVPTESHLDASASLDQMTLDEQLLLMNDEDAGIAAAVREAIPAISEFVRRATSVTANGGRLIYIGAGTSGRLGVLDASECPPTFMTHPGEVVGIIAGGDRSLRTSSEGLEDDPDGARDELIRLGVGPSDAVLGTTAGGTTPYVLGALRFAREHRALTGLLTCGSAPTDLLVDALIAVRTGPEVLSGSTRLKAGTATKMVLNMISTSLMVQRGKVHGNLMVDLRATNDKLRDRAARVISRLTGLDRDSAFVLLDQAGGEVKPAVVMHTLGVTRPDAIATLARAQGRLRDALEGSDR